MQGLSLVGLLVVIAIIIIMYANYTAEIGKTKARIEPEVRQMAGRTESGRPVADTYTLKASFDGGHLLGVRVETLAPDSPMRSYYGLQESDLITEVSSHGSMMRARDENDAELFKSFVASAYQTQDPIVVQRNGKQVTLKGNAQKSGSNNIDSVIQQMGK